MTQTLSLTILGSNQTQVDIGIRTYYFSYNTCVAYADGSTSIRRESNYSVTTAKHMSQMGVKAWRKVSDAEFEAIACLKELA